MLKIKILTARNTNGVTFVETNEYSVSTNSKTYDMHDQKLEYEMNSGVLLNFGKKLKKK